jgi:hypothetical protein
LAALAARREGRWRKGGQTQIDAHMAFHCETPRPILEGSATIQPNVSSVT